MKYFLRMMDAYRRYARRHPLRFLGINLILVIAWVAIIMHFSGENADISGNRSARLLVGIVNTVAPAKNVTLANYKADAALFNAEKVLRKLAHMAEYGFLSLLLWSVCFGIRDLSRRYAYIIPVAFTAVLAVIDEKNQTTITGRYGSWFDVCVDITAALIAVMTAFCLTRRYRREKGKASNRDRSS